MEETQEAKKKCPHCQTEISVQAEKCPQCRTDLRPWSSRHPILFVLSLVLVLLLLINVFNAITPHQQTTSASPAPTTVVTPVADTACSDVATVKATAKKVSYAELSKSPDAYTNTPAKFTGQILQILESNGQGIIRLSVTDLGGGVWSASDVVYVTYTGHNDFVNDDVVTVYGVLQGSYTYTSQANYEITLPSMEACSVSKTVATTS